MKAVLCALNAKYIHTNLAVRAIKAYADAHLPKDTCVIFEDTIHSSAESIAQKLLSFSPDFIAFSVYIWNRELVLEVIKYIRSESPDTLICLGGPEVSYTPDRYLSSFNVDFVQCGEGERPMTELMRAVNDHMPIPEHLGICYKKGEETVLSPYYTEANLELLESPYTKEYAEAINGRLAYFESSRGCPFSCAFCLSGGAHGVRFFPMDYVKRSLLFLWKSGVRTIKFVDRSFNCSVKHADEILSFILENAPKMPKVCFHLEIAADILAESTLALLEKAPKGLFQVEAGIQSFHPETLLAVSRKNDLEKICENVRKIISFGTVHTHVDLIAGLPNEGFLEFRNSFNKAYALGADMLQLGFLKLLYGSRLRKEAKEHGYIFETHAPYTVKASKWLSEGEMEKISFVEDANEKIANSGRFEKSLSYVLQKSSLSPFDLFLGFGKREPMPLDAYTDEVYEYFCSLNGVDEAVLRDLMCIDRLRTNKTGKLPKSLRRTDENLKKTVLAIEAMHPREKGVKRAVCLLYTQNKAVYVDYRSGEEMPFLFSYAPIAKQNEKQ